MTSDAPKQELIPPAAAAPAAAHAEQGGASQVPRHLQGLEGPPPGWIPPPPEPGGPPYEFEEVWEDGGFFDPSTYDPLNPPPDPDEDNRLSSETPPPYAPGLLDNATSELIGSALDMLLLILGQFWSPKKLARFGFLWQFQKFNLLDWLRPVELLLRRILLIEALALIASQALPPRGKARAKAIRPRKPRPPFPAFDPDLPKTWPENWKISFRVIPRAARPGRQRGPPRADLRPVQPNRQFREEVCAKRFRHVMHPSFPLAARLEVAIRIVKDPAPFARRLALRLRARANPNVHVLIARRPEPKPAFLRDARRQALERASELFAPLWEAYRSSA